MDSNAEYLRGMVGPVLSKGIAETTLAQPCDPVEYLATWLLKHVEGQRAKAEHLQLKKAMAEEQLLAEEERIKAVRAEQEAAAARAADLEALALLRGEPAAVCQAAADLVRRHTSAGAAYAAQVLDIALPEWAPPAAAEDEEGEGEGAGAETDDDDAAGKAEGEEQGEEEQEQEEEEAREEGEEGGAKVQVLQRPDYSRKVLAYVAATRGQEWLVGRQLARPLTTEAAEGEEQEEGSAATAKPAPVTFRMLDEALPLLHVPVVAREPRVSFFKPIPKIGAYLAAALRTPGGEYTGVLAADSLMPEGHGRVFTPEEQDWVWQVAAAASQALAASQAALQQELQGAGEQGAVVDTAALQATLEQLHKESAAAAAAAAPPANAEGEEGEGAGAEEEGDEGGEEAEDAVAQAQAAVRRLTAQVAALEAEAAGARGAVEASSKAMEVQESALEAVKQALSKVEVVGTKAMRGACSVPQATYLMLRAVLHVLGRPPASFDSWPKAQALVGPQLFQDLAVYDCRAPRDMAAWGRVRACYKAISSMADLESELEPTRLGLLLLLWFKEARRMARRAAILRDQQQKLEAAVKLLAARGTQLEEARAAQVKAEEEAAAAAAEAAAEAEEQEQEEDE